MASSSAAGLATTQVGGVSNTSPSEAPPDARNTVTQATDNALGAKVPVAVVDMGQGFANKGAPAFGNTSIHGAHWKTDDGGHKTFVYGTNLPDPKGASKDEGTGQSVDNYATHCTANQTGASPSSFSCTTELWTPNADSGSPVGAFELTKPPADSTP
jgi:hypothetical protein